MNTKDYFKTLALGAGLLLTTSSCDQYNNFPDYKCTKLSIGDRMVTSEERNGLRNFSYDLYLADTLGNTIIYSAIEPKKFTEMFSKSENAPTKVHKIYFVNKEDEYEIYYDSTTIVGKEVLKQGQVIFDKYRNIILEHNKNSATNHLK
jgi:hypothetical protein